MTVTSTFTTRTSMLSVTCALSAEAQRTADAAMRFFIGVSFLEIDALLYDADGVGDLVMNGDDDGVHGSGRQSDERRVRQLSVIRRLVVGGMSPGFVGLHAEGFSILVKDGDEGRDAPPVAGPRRHELQIFQRNRNEHREKRLAALPLTRRACLEGQRKR